MQKVKKRGKTQISHNAENALTSSSIIIDCPEKLPSNLILHLKTLPNNDSLETDESLVNSAISYNPSITTPCAYDPDDNVSFIYNLKKQSHENENQVQNVQIVNKTDQDKKDVNTLCWWCCHSFDRNSTIKLPLKKLKTDSYECIGLFCSPECACAFNLDSGSKYGDKWKQFELLHEMLGVHDTIRSAPKKELLNIFGGTLDIETFRGDTKWHILYPPMVSLKLQMDDTPASKDETITNFEPPIHINTLQVDDIQIEQLSEKKRKKNKKINNDDTLDRFWGVQT